jgi:ketosteroid isomerase-like protein
MRARRSLWFLFLAFLLAREVRGASEAPVRDLLQRQSQELLDALVPGTVAVWDRYLDEQVRYVDESGNVLTKKKMLEGIKPMPAGVSGSIRITDFDAVVQADVAVATYVADEHEDYHGHKLHCQYRTTETWRKTAGAWRLIGAQVLALRTDPPTVALPVQVREEYCGHYALTPEITYEIRCRGDALEGQRNGREVEKLLAEATDVLFVPGQPRYRYVFLRDASGRITGFAQRREAWDLVWKRQP